MKKNAFWKIDYFQVHGILVRFRFQGNTTHKVLNLYKYKPKVGFNTVVVFKLSKC